MAVTITTKFYEYDTPAWHDLSKVVFTSPNVVSPNTAGTRSHILPGELELATWYEDTSNMYNIFYKQVNSIESYQPAVDPITTVSGFDIRNSIKFEVSGPVGGECYDNRLTAWDDVTHSSTANYLINSDRVKISAVVYNYDGTEESPTNIEEVHPPSYNISLKGNTTSGIDYYYGDFNMEYRNVAPDYKTGDVLIFRPMLDNITSAVPYGVHDFVITLHYSYT